MMKVTVTIINRGEIWAILLELYLIPLYFLIKLFNWYFVCDFLTHYLYAGSLKDTQWQLELEGKEDQK